MSRADRYDDEEDVIASASKYHRPSCICITNIWARNARRLRSWKEATDLGLKPCGLCRPYHQQEAEEPTKGSNNGLTDAENIVSIVELKQWHLALLRLLDELDSNGETLEDDNIPKRINRLSNAKAIPRRTAAMMHMVVAMRNVAAHESNPLSVAESKSVREAWTAVVVWAQSNGFPMMV